MTERLNRLDGLRGIAAFCVVLSHVAGALMPSLVEGVGDLQMWAANSPLVAVYDGKLSVAIFFVLSGFVLSRAAASRRVGLAALSAGRIVRLSLPIAASIAFAFLCFSAMPDAAASLRASIENDWLLTIYNPPNLNVSDAAISAAGGAYFYRFDLNPVLWTMRIELLGSLVIYGVYSLTPERIRVALVGAMAAIAWFTFDRNYVLFLVGALMFEAWALGRLANPKLAWPALIVGLCLSSGLVKDVIGANPSRILSAIFIVYGVVSGAAARLLSSRVALFLGRISFPLYLTHFPIIFTLGALIYVASPGVVGLLAVLGIILPLCVGVAYAGTAFVDEPVVRLSHAIRSKVQEVWAFSLGKIGLTPSP